MTGLEFGIIVMEHNRPNLWKKTILSSICEEPWIDENDIPLPRHMKGWMEAIQNGGGHNMGNSKNIWKEIFLVANEVLREL